MIISLRRFHFHHSLFTIAVLVALLPETGVTRSLQSTTSNRVTRSCNTGWLFSSSVKGDGAAPRLNDASFDRVTLPHTIAVVAHHAIDTSVFRKITWYRKHLFIPDSCRGLRIAIAFQAVAKAATVYCNGHLVGEHRGAYTPFTVDITNRVSFGCMNIIAVQVDSRQRKEIPPEGRDVDYMVGAGIVRDVNIVMTNPVHVANIYARRDTTNPSCIAVTARIVNEGTTESSGTMRILLVNTERTTTDSSTIPYALAAGNSQTVHTIIGPVHNLSLWHPDKPTLYTLHNQLFSGARCLDEYHQRIGVRSISFSKTDGICRINGQPITLRGLNRHETYPYMGRAAANRLQRRDADILKYDFGCNVVRCSHYPQDPEFLDRCDEIGLLVLEEIPGWDFVGDSAWQQVARDNLTEMVIRDRNHPAIISFGVRINQSADFRAFYTTTNRIAHTLAPSIPTHGVRMEGRGTKHGFLEDVWAQNFFIPKEKPSLLPWITTEHVGHRYPTHSWDDNSRHIGQMLAHATVHDSASSNLHIAGLLGWCAFDYNSPYRYAEQNICYHGVADIFRIPKHAAYFYRSQADAQRYGAMVYIAHRWEKYTRTENIYVASNCDSVELFVNNRTLGKHAGNDYLSLPHPLFSWQNVRFNAGEIRAVGFINSHAAATCIRKTPGKPARLLLTPDDSLLQRGGDMTRVLVTVVDKRGETIPHNSAPVKIKVTGPAVFLGESPILLENGATAFYVKTLSAKTGKITCSVKAKKLIPARATITVQDATTTEVVP